MTTSPEHVPGSVKCPNLLRMIGLLLRRWMEEPIGVVVPLVAALLMLYAPQMPDMFAGMVESGSAPVWWQSLVFVGLPAAFLGFLSWYWTRAALWESCTCPDRMRRLTRPPGAAVWYPPDRLDRDLWLDTGRAKHSDDNCSHLWAPRIALLLAGLIVLSPVIQALRNDDAHLGDVPWETALIPLPVLLAFPLVVWRRKMREMLRAHSAAYLPTPVWMWRWRPAALLAAAPFGWSFALLLLALSLAGSILTGCYPDKIEDWGVPTPTAALIALGLVIGPLVLVLALLRDLTMRLILGLFAVVRGLRGDDRPTWEPDRTALLGFSRVIAILLLLFSVYWHPILGEPAGRYAVRRIEKAQEEEAARPVLLRPDLEAAVREWYAARIDAGYPSDKPMPAIIVAAEGGASRAATWLLSAMRLLDEKTDNEFGKHLFAISGVSGGSLGAVTYLHALRQHGKDGFLDWEKAEVEDGLRQLGSADLLAAGISTYFLNDTLGRVFGGLWPAPDRGVALEHAFERHWARSDGFGIPADQATSGLIAVHASGPKGMPHLFLNGTDRETGRRLITSTVRFDPKDDLFPDSDDLLAILRRDVPSATAVTNSARFPYVSPAGRFQDQEHKQRQILDGGYFENYGTRTASELATALSRLANSRTGDKPPVNLVPVVVVISNDADAARDRDEAKCRKMHALEDVTITCPRPGENGPSLLPVEVAQSRNAKLGGNSSELLAPLIGLAATRGAHGQDALHILRRQMCGTDGVAPRRMIHIALPAPMPPDEAAPMNWVLNRKVANFLINKAPEAPFNQSQAEQLRDLLQALSGKS